MNCPIEILGKQLDAGFWNSELLSLQICKGKCGYLWDPFAHRCTTGVLLSASQLQFWSAPNLPKACYVLLKSLQLENYSTSPFFLWTLPCIGVGPGSWGFFVLDWSPKEKLFLGVNEKFLLCLLLYFDPPSLNPRGGLCAEFWELRCIFLHAR
jgi:hypothetical protein